MGGSWPRICLKPHDSNREMGGMVARVSGLCRDAGDWCARVRRTKFSAQEKSCAKAGADVGRALRLHPRVDAGVQSGRPRQ